MIFETLNINKLMLDLDNSRFSSVPENQRQAIEFMLNQQGDKLLRLASDIIDHGIDPSERLVVVKDELGNYTVVEGNRRLTTLKILQNINIVNEDKTIRKIKKLLVSNPSTPKFIDCVVYQQDDERYEHWINLKHTGENNGVGRVQWKGQEVDRHKAKHGETSLGNQLINFIIKTQNFSDEIKLNTHKLKITNISRLLGDPSVRERLSLLTIDGLLFCKSPKEHLVSRLAKLLNVMLESDDNGKVLFTVDRIKRKDDRKDLLDQIGIITSETKLDNSWKLLASDQYNENTNEIDNVNDLKKDKNTNVTKNSQNQEENKQTTTAETPEKSEPETTVKETEEKATNKVKGSKLAHNPKRNMLIPASCKLNINDNKCSGLFRELKSKLTFDEHKFSISVLMRVFLEISLSNYMQLHSIKLDPRKTGLHDKVVVVTEDLRLRNVINGQQSTAI